MNRKNLTAAVLAGLAGAAGLAGTAQAVNLNPDGLGQVLIYPYYTTNDGNQTILSVVNTTNQAKAVKVRFLEGYNSREVLDFNLYLSAWDVWVAALADSSAFGVEAGVPHLFVADDSCTVPYLYDPDFDDTPDQLQPLLSLAYTGQFDDGGPQGIDRAAEGYFTMIEMGTLVGDSAEYATHGMSKEIKDKDGNVTRPSRWEPLDCEALTDQWTSYVGNTTGTDGIWFKEAEANSDCNPYPNDPDDVEFIGCQASTDTTRNSGGLFGGASIVNSANATMYSYDAKAIQGWDKTEDGVHYLPGSIFPTFNSGSQKNAFVFFGVPKNEAVELSYGRPVDAMSAVFMHENIMNEYTADPNLNAATEWVVTFPTKRFYVDEAALETVSETIWVPNGDDPECNSWIPGEPYPGDGENYPGEYPGFPGEPDPNPLDVVGWEGCTYIERTFVEDKEASQPFTELFDGEACELAGIQTWDRSERTYEPTAPGGQRPPVVSPSLPGGCDPSVQICETTQFELCYEVNVLRFGEESIFGTPDLNENGGLLHTVDTGLEDELSGWARIDFSVDPDHVDYAGLVGLPVTGFAAYEFENGFLTDDAGASVKAYYGGLFSHKANVRRQLQLRQPR